MRKKSSKHSFSSCGKKQCRILKLTESDCFVFGNGNALQKGNTFKLLSFNSEISFSWSHFAFVASCCSVMSCGSQGFQLRIRKNKNKTKHNATKNKWDITKKNMFVPVFHANLDSYWEAWWGLNSKFHIGNYFIKVFPSSDINTNKVFKCLDD